MEIFFWLCKDCSYIFNRNGEKITLVIQHYNDSNEHQSSIQQRAYQYFDDFSAVKN